MVEIPVVRQKYTWFKANGSAKSILDRVIFLKEWIQKWPECKQYVQPRVVSDHSDIVVKFLVRD